MENQELRDNTSSRIKETPIKELDRLNFCYIRIGMLLDNIEIIKNHADEFKHTGNLKNLELGQPPELQLQEYLILEICSFYDIIKKKKEGGSELDFPELPKWKGSETKLLGI